MSCLFYVIFSDSAHAGQVIGKITQFKGDVTVFTEAASQGKKAACSAHSDDLPARGNQLR